MTNLSGEDWFKSAAVTRLFELLNADGGEVRVVGGAVRNSLMGLPVGDIDLATTLAPQEVVSRAEAAGIKAVPTGIEHGTVTLVIDGKGYEVTTLRHDVETDGRRAQVAFGADWQEDAMRRDLTINALYVGQDGEVVDLVDGLKDIETKTVRFIGDADQRIAEDYLRVLRFFRFFAFYGGGRPDAAGLKASARARDKLSLLSAERIWAEMKKLLSAEDPGRALLWMRQAGVLTAILPETEKWGIDAIPGLIATEQALGWKPDPLLRLAAIVPRDPERLKAMAARLRLSNAEAGFLDAFGAAPKVGEATSDAELARLLYQHGPAGIAAVLRLALASARRAAEVDTEAMMRVGRLSALLEQVVRYQRPVFPLKGADALEHGIQPGPRVGVLLAGLEKEWVASQFSLSRKALIERLSVLAASS
ncbi:CCA tRNA nucleotidyltransferase [Peteryoungia desertarenae]|uniref:CCA tRNA nucleotidyltransferase n=1 Tax=Peteryoungia desertarenae TaxID=1813451 RepID=A0ABX6QR67_9HYPH|nr:CCA tRNA nucleotidyltransferase [Peteryoungia desertarenae]QLF70993.1 CCA tRNA nucleotidyltransferase [Peteryoungia desertarenae]